MNTDGSPNLWYGVSACVEDKHIHVRCDMDFITQLFILAEPDIRGSRTERHTKTMACHTACCNTMTLPSTQLGATRIFHLELALVQAPIVNELE